MPLLVRHLPLLSFIEKSLISITMKSSTRTTGISRLASYSNAIFLASAVLRASIVSAIGLPQPTGPYHVGVIKRTIDHFNPHDPLAPNNISTAFLATIFYPTLQKPEGEPEPYLNPETAAFYEETWNYTTGTLASITSTVQKDAPFLEGLVGKSHYPTILFGPGGGGPPVEGNTILLSELASYGYAVIGLDHPFEQPFLRYPNGTGVVGVDIDYNSGEQITAIYETRLVDNNVFLNRLPDFIHELKAPFNITHIGALGYSLGGAASIGSMYDHDRIVSSLNLDGSFFGLPNSTASDVYRPVLLLASEGHSGEGEHADPSWAAFLSWQTGYLRELSITGTTHHDFCDDTFWKTIEDTDPSTGPINGDRQVEILNTYVKAFFDLTLLGHKSSVLDVPSPEWPEIVFHNISRYT
ncbi:hypothetical protein F5Y04DRAFT_252687 [Hypomontagnella monticulosa]|nr:hypothetical protein F5Y04DRAFT_252687 [Hypomontagnella monticulosa]